MRGISLLVLSAMLAAGCGQVKRGVCSSGRSECDEVCVDTKVDAQNCGMCGKACAATERCVQGSCAIWCPAGFSVCGGDCRDLRSDVTSCGACDKQCTATEACRAGQCTALACPVGLTNCGAGCIDVRVADEHCGGCGMACAAGSICVAAACVAPPTCASGCMTGQLCTDGVCTCPTGEALCAGACVNRQADPRHCGMCGRTCVFGEECLSGTCTTTCRARLSAPVSDPWGLSWDGVDRGLRVNYAEAKQACTDLGARLPLATEIYRASAAQAGVVTSSTSAHNWTATPYDPNQRVIVARFTDGQTGLSNNLTEVRPFRCVCPPPPHKEFTGNNCYGPPGNECFTLQTQGKRINIDAYDRAPMPKTSAMYECIQSYGHLAEYLTLAEGILSGLPNGTSRAGVIDNWLHTADDSRYDLDTLIKWPGPQTNWAVDVNTTVADTTNLRPFRCSGINYDAGTHPNAVSGEFVGPVSGFKGETMDNATAGWAAAHDICYNRGGHLARSTELGQLIMQGLPNGTNALLWTADQASHDGVGFLATGLYWMGDGAAFRFFNAGSNGVTWERKDDAGHVYRCIYYPLDQTYTGPAEADCNGGCFNLTLPGTTPAVMWFDNNDRGAARLEVAINTCRAAGGHLASERDLTEAIRHGLPNGSGPAYISTWDIGYGVSTGAGTRFMIVRWTSTQTGYDDQHSTYMTYADLNNATLGYRCMWTNELR